MKIRRYIAKDAQEAMLKVKMDLGNEAVIISTRRVKQKGIIGFFSKPLIEVLATLDDNPKNAAPSPETTQPSQPASVLQEELKQKDNKINQLETKVNHIESLLQKIYGQIQFMPKQSPQQPQQQSQPAVPAEKTQIQPAILPEMQEDKKQDDGNANLDEVEKNIKIYQILTNNLIKNEVEPDLVKKLINTVKQKVSPNENVNEVVSALYNELKSMLGKPQSIEIPEEKKPYVIIFLGPTGVGKTTTLAKIAAEFSLNQKKNVGLITADTFRIAAVEQLKTYAEILGMPVSIVYSPNEISEAIKSYADKDVILIDTPGRSHKNKAQFEELKTLVANCNADQSFLLVSSTTGIKDCKDIIKSYAFMENYKIIFTKLDETSSYGIILNIRNITKNSLSYATIGQNVPDDIEIINVEKISKILLGSIPG
jgi:flagellar biosynthesis protein FlhF